MHCGGWVSSLWLWSEETSSSSPCGVQDVEVMSYAATVNVPTYTVHTPKSLLKGPE